LSALAIELPPLAARREDLPLVAQQLVEEANAAGGPQRSGLTPEALDLLAAHSWPGNLDELAEAIQSAHAAARGPWIAPADLPEKLRMAEQAAAHAPRPPAAIVLDDALADAERELLRKALADARGNKSRAAKLLGITRPRLLRRMEQLGLVARDAVKPAAESAPQTLAAEDFVEHEEAP
jgi:DNA-binding NtrC family response regulator